MKVVVSKLIWFHSDNIWVTGFIREGTCYIKEYNLLAYFSSLYSVGQFEQKLISANGQFSVIIQRPQEIWAATDRLRNYPLFYSWINGEFISAGDSFTRKFYYSSSTSNIIKRDFSSATRDLEKIFKGVFKNHFEALADRFIAISASGLSSMFYMQDYFAVKYLKVNNIIPENTVFMPGFSGDSLAGSFFVPAFESHKGKRQIASRIVNDKFVLINLDKYEKENISRLVGEKIYDDIEVPWKNYEDWEINPKPIQRGIQRFRERAKRFIPNTVINRLIDMKSPILYDEITSNMIQEIGRENLLPPRHANFYNSYLTQWYLMKTRKKFKLTEY